MLMSMSFLNFDLGLFLVSEQILRSFYNDTYIHRYQTPMSPSMLTSLWSLSVAIFPVGGMFGSLSVGYFANRFGR